MQLADVSPPSSPTSSSDPLRAIQKKKRQRTTPEQLGVLEKYFLTDQMPSHQNRIELARKLGMSTRRVQIWFQNKRAKLKRNSSNKDEDIKISDKVEQEEVIKEELPSQNLLPPPQTQSEPILRDKLTLPKLAPLHPDRSPHYSSTSFPTRSNFGTSHGAFGAFEFMLPPLTSSVAVG